MLKSKPPVRWTTALRRRLRAPLAAAAGALAVGFASGAVPARDGGVKILLEATVAESAQTEMTSQTWTALARAFVAGALAPDLPDDAPPSAEACRRAGDDFLLDAAFDLRPRLPGLANSSGRVAAQIHLTLRNCLTGETILDRTLPVDADPNASAEGDFESGTEVTWGRTVPAALKGIRLLGQVARVIRLAPPLAYVDFRGADLQVGQPLRDYARADRSAHPRAIELTVTQVFETYVEAVYSTEGGPAPSPGDLVETRPRTPPATPPAASPPAATPTGATPTGATPSAATPSAATPTAASPPAASPPAASHTAASPPAATPTAASPPAASPPAASPTAASTAPP